LFRLQVEFLTAAPVFSKDVLLLQRDENQSSVSGSITDIYQLSSVQSVLEMGYSRQTVKEAVDQLKCIKSKQMFDVF
jgi:Holliday junction resolvasome RuvABC DNA-binding subunit